MANEITEEACDWWRALAEEYGLVLHGWNGPLPAGASWLTADHRVVLQIPGALGKALDEHRPSKVAEAERNRIVALLDALCERQLKECWGGRPCPVIECQTRRCCSRKKEHLHIPCSALAEIIAQQQPPTPGEQ